MSIFKRVFLKTLRNHVCTLFPWTDTFDEFFIVMSTFILFLSVAQACLGNVIGNGPGSGESPSPCNPPFLRATMRICACVVDNANLGVEFPARHLHPSTQARCLWLPRERR